ncbi:MAG: hypothetical protein J1F39_05165 [Clostridiales bacterium]|nr:hypothetical protein [Clostridiales bacterium]
MKRIAKRLVLVLIVVLAAFSVFAFAACDKPNANTATTYTVTVVDKAGNPYTTAKVQPCIVESNGELGACYQGVATDANGVAVLEIGKSIPDTKADLIEVHLLELPTYLTYKAPRIKRGAKVTITVSPKTAEELDKPSKGTGVGGYYEDGLGNSRFDLENFDPYVVGNGSYGIKFTSVNQNIYFAYQAYEEGFYRVYSYGEADLSVTQYLGSIMTGLHSGGSDFGNDNVSATDKNFSYEFVVSPSDFEEVGGDVAVSYFEISLQNAADANKDSIICFEFVKEYEEEKEPEVVDVTPAGTLTQQDNHEGYFVEADLNGEFEYEKSADGKYRTPDGDVLYATLGKGSVTPQGLSDSFTAIYEQGQTFTFNVDGVKKNYYPLVEAYTDKSNDEGRYPVTDELIDFFTVYIDQTGFESWFTSMYYTTLPEGEEWLVWCGYYVVNAGTVDDPFPMTEGSHTVKVPTGGEVVYSAFLFGGVTCEIKSTSTNVLLTVKTGFSSDDLQVLTTVQSTPDGFSASFEPMERTPYYLVFSTVNGQAEDYVITVKLVGDDPDGSLEKPFEIFELGTYYGYMEDYPDLDEVYHFYNITDETTLYFFNGSSATIVSVTYTDSSNATHTKSFDELANGLSVTDVSRIVVRVAITDSSYTFTVSTTPLGSKSNPFEISDGDDHIDVVVPEGSGVFYSIYVDGAGTYTLTSDSGNIKLNVYVFSMDSLGYVLSDEYASNDGSFTLTLGYAGSVLLEFRTVNGSADSYTVNLNIEFNYEEGTPENPIVITELKKYTHTFEDYDLDLNYLLSISDVSTLYFDWDSNTAIMVSVDGTYYSSRDEGDAQLLKNGLDVSGVSEIIITVMVNESWTATTGNVSFTVSATAIA